MRALRIIEHISLDGVIQLAADDDDLPCSDWTAPYRTPAGRDVMLAASGERFDLLLGRRTCDIWSGYWPKAPSSPMEDRLTAATETVATHRPESRVPVCSDAASEGLNLQTASALINYDLPWNPARVEQRIGRTGRGPGRPALSPNRMP